MHDYIFYVCDTETTGLDFNLHSPIEISLIRLPDGEQKTWFLKPCDLNTIEASALKVNGHKLEDLKGETKEGRSLYLNPDSVIVDIENWLISDMHPSDYRCLIGQNIYFDRTMLEKLWEKCSSKDSFPFGRRCIDTMVIELFTDFCKNDFKEGYSLNNLIKKYGIKNEKAHTASSDAKVTKEVFLKQFDFFKKIL